MKTPEEWCEELGLIHEFPSFDIDGRELTMAECVEKIQLDAWKQGMTDAAEIVKYPPDKRKWPTSQDPKETILTERDKTK